MGYYRWCVMQWGPISGHYNRKASVLLDSYILNPSLTFFSATVLFELMDMLSWASMPIILYKTKQWIICANGYKLH